MMKNTFEIDRFLKKIYQIAKKKDYQSLKAEIRRFSSSADLDQKIAEINPNRWGQVVWQETSREAEARQRRRRIFQGIGLFILVLGIGYAGWKFVEPLIINPPQTNTATADLNKTELIPTDVPTQAPTETLPEPTEIPSPTPIPTEPPPQPVVYSIKEYALQDEGSCTNVAEKFGISPDLLQKFNKEICESLNPGDILQIPNIPFGIESYVPKDGETCDSVAERFHTSAQVLEQLNSEGCGQDEIQVPAAWPLPSLAVSADQYRVYDDRSEALHLPGEGWTSNPGYKYQEDVIGKVVSANWDISAVVQELGSGFYEVLYLDTTEHSNVTINCDLLVDETQQATPFGCSRAYQLMDLETPESNWLSLGVFELDEQMKTEIQVKPDVENSAAFAVDQLLVAKLPGEPSLEGLQGPDTLMIWDDVEVLSFNNANFSKSNLEEELSIRGNYKEEDSDDSINLDFYKNSTAWYGEYRILGNAQRQDLSNLGFIWSGAVQVPAGIYMVSAYLPETKEVETSPADVYYGLIVNNQYKLAENEQAISQDKDAGWSIQVGEFIIPENASVEIFLFVPQENSGEIVFDAVALQRLLENPASESVD